MKQAYGYIVEESKKRILVGKKADIIAIAADFPGTMIEYAANLEQLLASVKAIGYEVICHNPTTKMEQMFAGYKPTDTLPPAPPSPPTSSAPDDLAIRRFCIQPIEKEFAVMVATNYGVQYLNRGLLSKAKDAYLKYVADRSLLMTDLKAATVPF
ncbi:hypothetical protein GZH47_33040 (plasmid) [Paenibacillus rhizovicinus]|uniref:Uncharacterized protein n=1 Tax=Paenibacillus rhizovicinus TaxID=2704463 RepID=A0A6C0PBF0_9BACL|nr:hypothetical protein [Paenibacillus rhizovicinus]QHW35721.1 hypothetical protein GZH47_33040 [Paenibacillus rhizovicinus]